MCEITFSFIILHCMDYSNLCKKHGTKNHMQSIFMHDVYDQEFGIRLNWKSPIDCADCSSPFTLEKIAANSFANL